MKSEGEQASTAKWQDKWQAQRQARAFTYLRSGGRPLPETASMIVNGSEYTSTFSARDSTAKRGKGRVDIDFSRLVNSVIENGGADSGMRRRFGASPRGSGA